MHDGLLVGAIVCGPVAIGDSGLYNIWFDKTCPTADKLTIANCSLEIAD